MLHQLYIIAAYINALLLVCVKIEARYRGRWDWFKAVVTVVRQSGYDVRYDDGETESNVHRALLRQVLKTS